MSAAVVTHERAGTLRRFLTFAGVVAMLAAILLVFAPTTAAHAECKPPGVPDYAGSGVNGDIDPKIPDPSGGNKYGQYGWAGLRWNNCDIRDVGALTDDLVAVIDTWAGNAFLGLAVGEGAVMTSMHKWTANPTATLAPIDDKIVQLSTITREVLFDDWAFPVIAFAVLGVAVAALTRSVRTALMTTGAILVALGFVALVGTIPLQIAQSTDGVASGIVSAADQRALEYAGIPSENGGDGKIYANTDEATGAILNDAMLQPMWRLGQTGFTKWQKTTDDMFTSSTASWKEVKAGYKPDDKKDAYNKAVDAVKNDPSTANQYQSIKGQSYNRAGAGFMAAFMMTVVAAIRIPAEALMTAGMLVIRFIPLLGPLFALLAIPEQTRGAATAALKIVAASIYNVVVFGVIASVHTAITAILYVNTENLFVSTIISAICTFLLWKMSKPFRSVTKLATGKQVAMELANAPDAPGNAVKGVVGLATGTVVGSMMSGNGNQKQKEENGKKRQVVNPDREHPGPEIHPGWREAPQVNQAWSEAPKFTPENKWEGLTHSSEDWDEPVFTPGGEDTKVRQPAAPQSAPEPAVPEVAVLNDWEIEGGQIVTSIFVPEGVSAGEHTSVDRIDDDFYRGES